MTEKDSRLCDYSVVFSRYVEFGLDSTVAAIKVADTYLDGKPTKRGKHKISLAERDAAFWSSDFLDTLPAEVWLSEPFVLALTRYFNQSRVSNLPLMEHIAALAPASIHRAIRYSGLVLHQDSPRRAEIDCLGVLAPAQFGELVCILDVFDGAYRERLAEVERLKRPLSSLTPLELMVYASLYAFEYLVPQDFLPPGLQKVTDNRPDTDWEAINDLLIWKLGSTRDKAYQLTDKVIGQSLAKHLAPFLFPSPSGPKPREDLYEAFLQLLAAQIELNSFISQSADVFSYDESVRFVLKGERRLEFVQQNPDVRAVWERNGRRFRRLQGYWLYRGIEAFFTSELANVTIGSPENHEANQFAYIKALRSYLQLTEVYGLADTVTVESGSSVDLFQTLLSLELMTAFFVKDYLQPYLHYLNHWGNARLALCQLAFGGLVQPEMQNRFPVTWSDRITKIARIKGWTVNEAFPQGSSKAAAAILDFWTSDWTLLSRRLRKKEPGLRPRLIERPILKMGQYLFQFPWVVGIQNNATAAINNLRRIGARRSEAREETRRIEVRLAEYFEERGFRVLLNFEPERNEEEDPGEVDLICVQDGQVLVLEIKSTFLRQSQKEAWLHGATTLRKAGLQLHRKVQAVEHALTTQADFAAQLGMADDDSWNLRGWIVDTSIEHDHARFNGFLKVSLEEVLIALRDDRHLLNDPIGLLDGTFLDRDGSSAIIKDKASSLYPEGFTASRFVEVFESEAFWDEFE